MRYLVRETVTVSLIFLSLGIASNAIAGNEYGNGGETLVCRQDNEDSSPIVSVELFDYFEARELAGLTVDLGGEQLDEWKKAELALERIRTLSPRRYTTYLRHLKEFPQKMRLLPTALLSPLNDSRSIVIPRTCKVMQAAIRKNEPGIPFTYFIDREIWDAMNSTQRAGLILHEILHISFYRMIDDEQGDSTFTRRFNALLADTSVGIATFSIQRFTDLLFELDNNWIESGKLVFDIVPIENQIWVDPGDEPLEEKFNLEYYPDGKVKQGRLATRLGIMMPVNGFFTWSLNQGSVREIRLQACAFDIFLSSIHDPRERPCGNVTFSSEGKLTSLKGRGVLVFADHQENFRYDLTFNSDGTVAVD
jgi:hypothetical protein